MKPNHKRPSIYPSQFIEDIVKFHDSKDMTPINLDIRKFQHAVEELKSSYDIHFEYIELVNYAKRFNRPFMMIEELEIHLHPKWFKQIQDHLAIYNRMYDLNDEIVSGNISKVLKKIK